MSLDTYTFILAGAYSNDGTRLNGTTEDSVLLLSLAEAVRAMWLPCAMLHTGPKQPQSPVANQLVPFPRPALWQLSI